MGSRLGNEQMTLLRKMDDLKTHPTPSECSKMLTWGGGTVMKTVARARNTVKSPQSTSLHPNEDGAYWVAGTVTSFF